MAPTTRDQSLPAHVLAARSYELIPGAHNISRGGTLRAGRWPTIVKYDGHPDGISLAHREAGVTKRHFNMLERRGQLRLLASGTHQAAPVGGTTVKETPGLQLTPEDEESRHPEGAASYRLHRRLERDATLAAKAKQKRLAQTGCLSRDVCSFDFEGEYGELGTGYIEAHHTVPVSELTGDTRTQLRDFALVCSNCHRMLHRGPKLLSVEEVRALRQHEE